MKIVNIFTKKIAFNVTEIPFDLVVLVIAAVINTVFLILYDLFFDSKIFENNFFNKHPMIKGMIGIFIAFFIVMISRIVFSFEDELNIESLRDTFP
jgi:quinol-cytochrome oxidoreductase complex cytochrome b subunit